MKDVTLDLDDFGRNRIVDGPTAMAQQLYVLLNMVPGDCEDDPEKGIDMRKYRIGIADENAPDLKNAIQQQVSKYCDFETSDVEVLYKDGELVVGVSSPAFSEIVIFRTNGDNILASIIAS